MDPFGIILGSIWDCFGIILGSCWDHFAIILGSILDHVWDHIGIILGSIVPEELGLTFTIPLTFLALLVSYLRNYDHLVVIILSGITSIIFFNAPFKSYIIISSLIALVGAFFIIKFKKRKK